MNKPAAITAAALALLIAAPASARRELSRPKNRIGVIDIAGGDCAWARVAAAREAHWGNSPASAETTSGNTSYQNHHRWYSPDLGRSLSAEPFLGSPTASAAWAQTGQWLPAYSYALNDPLRYVDRTGLAPDDSGQWERWAAASHQMSFEERVGFGVAGVGASVLGFGLAAIGSSILGLAPLAPPLVPVAQKAIEECERRPIGGVITGFTRHGLNQAISREGFGVSPQAILHTVRNGVPTLQSNGTIKYVSDQATVVVNQSGVVVTVVSKSTAFQNMSGGTLVP